jgi:hypothetical protein
VTATSRNDVTTASSADLIYNAINPADVGDQTDNDASASR